MYQDFARTKLGYIRVDTGAIISLVSRWLPKDVQCSAVRLRANDRLCLVVISDRREFWSREDDLRRAHSIAADLRSMGMDLPRLQWIRQSQYFEEHPPFAEQPLYSLPSFWMNIAGAVFAFFALSLWGFLCYAGLLCAAWFISAWLISGGWSKIERLLPFLASFRRRQN
ncbi:MAG: cytochrome D ubiquinol oxidase subunit I [Pyramidobacter sp.]